MPSYSVVFAPAAKVDLEVIYQHYILVANDKVADILLTEVEKAIESLAAEPLLGHIPLELNSTGKDCLECLTKSFRLIYKIGKNQVTILAVLHQRQSLVKALNKRWLH